MINNRIILVLYIICFQLYAVEENTPNNLRCFEETLLKENSNSFILSTKKIEIKDFPKAYNPSILKSDEGILLSFKYRPDLSSPWIYKIGIVLLDDSFQPISQPSLLNTRFDDTSVPSQCEDARIFAYKGKIYFIYNDCLDVVNPSLVDRRDMYIAQIIQSNGHFELTQPIKLTHKQKYLKDICQKNWVPFVWNDDTLLLSYKINPHEILYPNLSNGICEPVYETFFSENWPWGQLRGGTQALLVDGEYLAFFHSSLYLSSDVSLGHCLRHYFIGAYTFSSVPPFEITKISKEPIIAEGFYTTSDFDQRVVFPCGYIIAGSKIYLAYGKDDCEIWIAEIDKVQLMKTLKQVER